MKKVLLFLIFITMVLGIFAQSSPQIKSVKNVTSGKPVTPGVTSSLSGVYIAPSGTSIGLQNNKTDTLSLVAAKDTAASVKTVFKFSKPLVNAAVYNVSIRVPAAGMATKITNGQGVVPIIGKTLKVECDYNFDLVTRSTKDATFSTFYESSSPAVAGGNKEEGRYVAFVSNSVNFSGTIGKFRQIFWRDRNTGITKLVSATPNGKEGTL